MPRRFVTDLPFGFVDIVKHYWFAMAERASIWFGGVVGQCTGPGLTLVSLPGLASDARVQGLDLGPGFR